jgi:hypothetical protein
VAPRMTVSIWALVTAFRKSICQVTAVGSVCLACASMPVVAENDVSRNVSRNVSRDEFLAAAFYNQEPEQKMLWLDSTHRDTMEEILGHPYRGLRIRYWAVNDRLAWILDEIGKDKPITIGVVAEDGRVMAVTVLEFRETRGGEVRYDFFTNQFLGAGLRSDLRLDQDIDGITGATLSVRAVIDVAELALYLSGSLAANNQMSSNKQVESLD